MNVSVYKTIRILVYPSVAPRRQTTSIELNMCEDEVDRIRATNRDEYYIDVEYLRVTGYNSLDEASSMADVFGRRRQLNLAELLCLNQNDPHIRSMWPIFAGDYVLESIPLDYDEVEQRAEKKWTLRHSATHRGIVIDKDALFATTCLTKVDLDQFDKKYVKDLVSVAVSNPPLLK